MCSVSSPRIARQRTIGVLLADEIDGPFSLDLKSVVAMRANKEFADMDVE